MFFFAGSVSAQNYVIEPASGGNFGDLYYVLKSGDAGGYATNIMKGKKVTIAPEDQGFQGHDIQFVKITVDGEKYYIAARDLKFGENPAGTVDWVADYEEIEKENKGMSFGKILLWIVGIAAALLLVYGLFSRRSSAGRYDYDDYDEGKKGGYDLWDQIERDNKRTEEANERRRQEEEWYRRQRKNEKPLF